MPVEDPKPTKSLGLSSTPVEPVRRGNSWFLGIGINNYRHFDNLNNAVKDVKDLLQLLQEEYEQDQSYTITLYNEAARRENIIEAFDALVKQVQPEDKVLIYYSGHGHLERHDENDENKSGFWMPFDAKKDNTANHLRNWAIIHYLKCIKAKHVLLISDACFSGTLFYDGKTRNASRVIGEMERRRSRWALCSGRHDEEVFDGKAGTNSPFAASLLSSLRENRPALNISKLIEEVIESTGANYEQLPEGNPVKNVGHDGGQYVFWRGGKASNSNASDVAPTPPQHSIAGVMSAVPKKGSYQAILRWFLFMAAYQILAILGVITIHQTAATPQVDEILLTLIPFAFYLAPYLPAIFSRLSRQNLLLLTGGYGLVYYALLLVWKTNTGESYPWWQYFLMLVVGLALYYIFIPLLNKANNQ